MKAAEQILDYAKEQVRELTKEFKNERKLANQFDRDSSFYEYHHEKMNRESEKLGEMKNLLKFITENDDMFFEIYNSIKD